MPGDNVAVDLNDPTAVEAGERVTALSGKLVSIAAITCYACLFGAAFYSLTMTVSGFIGTKLLPDNSIIGNSIAPWLIGFVLEGAILGYYVALPRGVHYDRSVRPV